MRRVDLVAPPMAGHLHPVLGIAARLAEEPGVEVRVVSTAAALAVTTSAGLTGEPSSSVAAPIPSRSISRSIVTTTCGDSPPLSGSSPQDMAIRQTSTSASARRCHGPRESFGRGAHNGSNAARTTAASVVSNMPESLTWPPPTSVN